MAALTLCGCAALTVWAQPKSDWERLNEERNWREIEVALPPFPRREDRLPFNADPASDFHFFVDRPSIAVGADGVVRYALIAVSPLGAENVSFEGVRCGSREHKAYATGRADGTWSRREGAWREGAQSWQKALRADYFCPLGVPIANAAEGVNALRRGGHPNRRHVSND